MNTFDVLSWIEDLSARRKDEIRRTADDVTVKGVTYYVSADGDDGNDGKSPDTPWRTVARVNREPLREGDGVRFRRGDVFRGGIEAHTGVTYAAYGKGEKPALYGWIEDLADPALWERCGEDSHIWKYKKSITDCGTLVFDGGKQHSRKLIPSYIGGRFVCREDETRLFVAEREMTQDLDLYTPYDRRMVTEPSKGENFPVPLVSSDSFGELYLRCDRGNPGEVFSTIEAVANTRLVRVGNCNHVTVDNLTMKYACFAVSAGGRCVEGLTVQNCEIGWIGGNIQHYLGTDPNYPEGRRGMVTRFGNGVEIYGGCRDYTVRNCYIYQCYDAAVTHQMTTNGERFEMTHVQYLCNLIEYCVYSVEYFLEKSKGDTASCMCDIEITDNILRHSGYGWGQQRHNKQTPAHIKGWSYENTAQDYTVHGNILDRAAYRMLHLVAKEQRSCPAMYGNTYIQYRNGCLGKYGANVEAEPTDIPFDEDVADEIFSVLRDPLAKVYILDPQ